MSLEMVLIPLAIGVVQVISDKSNETSRHLKSYSIPTLIKDESILKRALDNYGTDLESEKNNLKTTISDIDIIFEKGANSQYIALFDGKINADDAERFINNIQKEYISIVQRDTYAKLLNRAEEYGMELELEEELEDRGVVLTFKVNQ
ncbi:hypothetical protein [Thalassobacillus pellis]|uniref:hypothetical protein n=1 Tax=Thalassobacillus pellis TaxID=748008 RepID=UPI0019610BA6|nr:hypothetical protein [Thalassobacillus pellis]MBM7553230.1 hypothetical protein [Thalassobacillus pellis]